MGTMGLLSWLREWIGPREPDPLPPDDDDGVDPYDPFPDPSAFPVRDVLDLHGLPPKMVREVVESYLDEAHRLGFAYVRIVHGKGIGVQREAVRKILARTPFVETFGDAPPEAGGWGATIVTLKSQNRAR